jgi:hypothetical protein
MSASSYSTPSQGLVSGEQGAQQEPGQEQVAISATFADPQAAQAAIQELREVGIPADCISVISREEEQPGPVPREELTGGTTAYRASTELPNDEDLPDTTAEAIRGSQPVVTDFEVPPDEPLGGGDGLGLSRDSDLVRRYEATGDADVYTDFPGTPGGIDPQSPASKGPAAGPQEPKKTTDAAEGAVVGVGLGSIAGLLAGLAGLAIPGVGPFIAAGPLAGALSGMLAGGAAGGIIGALSTVGVPDEYAREYAALVEQGHTLVSVLTDEISLDQVERVLAAHGGENIHCGDT